MNPMVGWVKSNGKIKRSRKLPLSKSCWMVSSGKTPRDPGPHSFSNDWQMLYMTPLLISEVFDRRLSMLIAATFQEVVCWLVIYIYE